MSKKTGTRRKKTARGKQGATRDLTTPGSASVERGEVTGGGKTFLIFVSGPNGRLRDEA